MTCIVAGSFTWCVSLGVRHQTVACPPKIHFNLLSFDCSLEVRASQQGGTWAAHLLTLLHFKVWRRTLRSPTLHLRWRRKETRYALKKLIPEDGCQTVTIRWRRSFYPFWKSDAIRAAFYRSVISVPGVDTALMCFWMSHYAQVEDSLQ